MPPGAAVPSGAVVVIVLGIETSCDETAVAILDDTGRILAEQVRAQWAEHATFGGVVPEVAARLHLDVLDRMIVEALHQAGLVPEQLDVMAATAGPGLVGGLIVGISTAKALAMALGKPFIAINHLEAHILTVTLTDRVALPYLALLVSGGHCQLIWAAQAGKYRLLGQTLDDSVGEAFDKTARLLGLPWPGGPALEQLARQGRADRYRLPRPMLGRAGCDFSFAGLKTAVRRIVEAEEAPLDRADLAASFQAAAIDVLADRAGAALAMLRSQDIYPDRLVVSGGVAANLMLRDRLARLADIHQVELTVPPIRYCTDNAVMVAWAAIAGRHDLRRGSGLDFPPHPRWPVASGESRQRQARVGTL